MASEYEWGKNIIRDTLVKMMYDGIDVSNIKFRQDLYFIFGSIIEDKLKNHEDLIYMDFDIKQSGVLTKVIGNNIVSALWLSGIMPNNPTIIEKENKCYIGDRKYTFNKKNKILRHTLKK